MSIRKLFAIFLALTVLFAPAVSHASVALAGVPDHELMIEQTGHCQMPSGAADHAKGAGKSCCISMCMAIAINGSAPSDDHFAERMSPVSTVPIMDVGYPGEIATPPPRQASDFLKLFEV